MIKFSPHARTYHPNNLVMYAPYARSRCALKRPVRLRHDEQVYMTRRKATTQAKPYVTCVEKKGVVSDHDVLAELRGHTFDT